MLRDEEGGVAVNLIPQPKPADIYQRVADRTTEYLRQLDQGLTITANGKTITALTPICIRHGNKPGPTWQQTARDWLAFGISRKVVKRNVMTLPYGATLFSHRTFLRDAVADGLLTGKACPYDGQYAEESCYAVARIVWQSISDVITSARLCMDWLQAVAKASAKAGLPVTWVAPSGFLVHQAYPDLKKIEVKLCIGEKYLKLTCFSEVANKFNPNKQRTAIAPNFVHSCDAAALVEAVVLGEDVGIKSFSCIHDSFGTHAADTEAFAKAIREGFVGMYQNHDVLKDLANQLKAQGISVPPLPAKGNLDISAVLNSLYCFA
jgi:DNA-directed RNA polymerase